jgi:hypothetical protein
MYIVLGKILINLCKLAYVVPHFFSNVIISRKVVIYIYIYIYI